MRFLIALTFITTAFLSFSQLKLKYNQYMLHPTIYNPGYVDPETKYSVNFLYRRQWQQQENFPEEAFLYGHYNFNKTHGMGFMVSNDLINKLNQFEIAANYVYNIPFGRTANLGLGIKAAFTEQNLLNHNLVYFDPVEPTLDGGVYTIKSLNLGTGVSISSKTFNFHIGLPSIFGNYVLNPSKKYSVKNNHLYTMMGYKIRFSDWFILYPNALVQAVPGSKIHASVNVNALASQLMWMGLGFDSDYTGSVSVGLFMMSGFRLIYNYDVTYFTKHPTTGPSHEFSLSYAKSIDDNPFRKRKTNRYKLKRMGKGRRK